ncbi:MAG: diguanylate cyclase [Bacillota bacterium]
MAVTKVAAILLVIIRFGENKNENIFELHRLLEGCLDIDVKTLAFVLSISLVLQVVALYAQYRMNKMRKGLVCWLLGSGMLALGFLTLLLRDVETIEHLASFVANTLILLGQICLYLGVLRFLGRKENRWIIGLVLVVFVSIFYDYAFIHHNSTARVAAIYIALALVSLLTAEKLFSRADPRISFSANFTAVVFLCYGAMSLLRAVLMLVDYSTAGFFKPLLIEELVFLFPIITSSLWTSGLILMVNQRLSVESAEAQAKIAMVLEERQLLVEQLEIEKRYEQMTAMTDSLTGLANRRSFDEKLSNEFYRLRRSGAVLSLIMLDVDHFKMFNDEYGHLAGDDCLQKIAEVIKANAKRAYDTAARYGGEEFVVILPEVSKAGAITVADNIRRQVEALHIPHAESRTSKNVTVSLGVISVSTELLISPEKIVALADEALYDAKQSGRNRVKEITYNPQTVDELNMHNSFVRLIWHANNESGHKTIDRQHRKLFEVINELLSAVIEQREKTECYSLIDMLLLDVINHFNDEEEILAAADYPFIDEHRAAHEQLVNKLAELSEMFMNDRLTLGELFSFLAYDVVAQHLMLEDKKYFPNIHNYVSGGG